MALPLGKATYDTEAGGPYITAARGRNKLRQEELETEFYPDKIQAENASKRAYAKFVGPQMIAQILGGAAAGNLSPEEYQKYVSQMTGMLQPDQQNSQQPAKKSNSLAGEAFDYLMNKLMPKKTQEQQPFSQTSLSNQVPASSSNPFSSGGSRFMMPEHPDQQRLLRQAEGNNNYNQSITPNPPINSGNVPSSRPQTMNELRLAQKAKAKVEEKNQIDKAKTYNKEWTEKTKEIGHSSKAAHDFGELIKSFKAIYPKLHYLQKGNLGNLAPAWTAEAQKADKVTELAAQTLASVNQHGQRITNMDLLSAQKGVPRRGLEPGAAKAIPNQLEAVQKRVQEQVPFFQKAKEMEMTTGKADEAWLQYIDKYPLYNHDTDELIPRTGKEYNKFLNEFNSNMQSGRDDSEGQLPPPGSVWMLRPDNVKVPVLQNRVEEAKKNSQYKLVE